ncbi:MAG: formate dehydrogenase accessory sulfurtransferase FdhD [Methanocorpusculum sp.]|nr:formate dehydrogenase accessory sulfurtransferase FdhD [Methanocorpusculum sp.]
MYDKMISKACGLKYRNGNTEEIEDTVVIEEKIKLYLNGEFFIEMVASDDFLAELGAGFFIASGIAEKILSVKVEGLSVFVEAERIKKVEGALESAGGFDPGVSNKIVSSQQTITPEIIFKMRSDLDADVWNETGGLHCTVLYSRGKKAAMFSDIGRHNTVDKAIGFMVLNNLNPAECAIGCTGRQPSGMVVKAVNAGIPIIVSRAASTTAGIKLAEKSNVTLICFTREGRFTIYAGAQRVIF